MQFIVLVDGKIIGQAEINTDSELDRLLEKFPSSMLKTPSQMLDEGWR